MPDRGMAPLPFGLESTPPLPPTASIGIAKTRCTLLLLPLSPFPACPLPLSFLFGFVRPVPWPLRRVGPVVEEPGFGHYVGRPPALSL